MMDSHPLVAKLTTPEKKAEVVVLKVRRGIRTLFVELQSTWTTEAVGR